MRRKVKQQPQKFPDYVEENGKLYRHNPHRAGNKDVPSWIMCVPRHANCGTLGSRKTIARIAARYHWPGMHRGIKKYVRNCESCMKYKPSQPQAAGKMLTQVPEEPWAIVCTPLSQPTEGRWRVSYGSIREKIDAI